MQMAQLQLPILPKRLYRYRSLTKRDEALNDEIDSIRNKYIYCSDFSKMNDPMEGFFESSPDLRSDSAYRQVLRQIKDRKLSTGLACFSETKENVLMWAHYADNYAGICLEYSSAELVAGLPRSASFVRMAYVDELPEVTQNEVVNFDDAAIHILSQKQSAWAYEREWRLLSDLERVSVGRRQPVKAIYFGPRISKSHRQRILTRLQGTKIKGFKMTVNGYEHSFEPVNDIARKST